MPSTGGGSANKQGKVLESTILPCLERHGFKVERYSSWIKEPEAFGDELVLTNVPYQTIYGHRGFTEFLLVSKSRELKIRIECKWQQSGGSVDEKLPYLYLNCLWAVPEDDIIIVVGGGGMKKGAIAWLKSAVDERLFREHEKSRAKRIKVYTLDEFLIWANSTFGRAPSPSSQFSQRDS